MGDAVLGRISRHAVPRPRLTAPIDALLPLTLLRAPHGYGKTTLAAQWATALREAGARVLWLPTPHPPDGSALWHRLVRQGWPDRDDVVDASAVAPLLAEPGPPVVVFLDEADTVDEATRRTLVGLVRASPRLHLVACTRTHFLDPAEWLDLDTQELGPEQLAFDLDEIAEVLRQLGLDPGTVPLVDLAEDLAGWPLAVRAFARVLSEDVGQPGAYESALTRLRAQLSRTVLAPFRDQDLTRVVLRVALLSDFDVDDLAALGIEVDDPLFQELVALGMVVPLASDAGPRYTWVGIARSVLVDELERRDPDGKIKLHRQLAEHFRDRQDNEKALRHGLDGAAWEFLRNLIDVRMGRLLMLHDDLLRAILAAAPEDAFDGSVAFTAMRSSLFPGTTHTRLAVAYPDDLRALARSSDPFAMHDQFQATLWTLRMSGHLDRALELAGRADELIDAVRAEHPGALLAQGAATCMHTGLVHLQAGDLRTATSWMERSHRFGAHSLTGHILRDSAVKLALIHALARDVGRAAEWIGRADQAPMPDLWVNPWITGHLGVARTLYAVATLDPAATALAAEHPAPELVDDLWVLYAHARARTALLWGHPAAALREVQAAPPRGEPPPEPFMRDLLLADAIDLLIRMEQGNRCVAMLDRTTSHSPLVEVRRARLALLTGEPETAAELARAAAADPAGHRLTDIDALLLEAVALRRTGDRQAAVDRARTAVLHAGGLLEPFALAPRADLTDLATALPELAAILVRLDGVPEPFPQELALIRLSPRERVVLQHLAAGRTLQRAARMETVSLATIKSQTHSLYRKLGASNREQAVRAATFQGLID